MKRRHTSACECGDHAFQVVGAWAVCLVSLADGKILNDFYWSAWSPPNRKTSYVIRNKTVSYGAARMHRLILTQAEVIDHVNGNGLDNRRANLRDADKFQSAQNRTRKNKKGTVWKMGAWEVRVQAYGVRKYIGRFRSMEDANRAYCDALIVMHKQFANTKGVSNG